MQISNVGLGKDWGKFYLAWDILEKSDEVSMTKPSFYLWNFSSISMNFAWFCSILVGFQWNLREIRREKFQHKLVQAFTSMLC